ncbi:DUF6498-containing protein [Halohasta litorea]|uniref:DUF6498-containing protein n=1 Tax=Halohasta litorea TaxID=869891 RepID=A0ABD6D404_9EURY|nr:DUF6498-containing protein [Halohasta litorea]
MALGVVERASTPRPELFAVLVGNGLPLIGVVALGWDAAALLFLYWLELGVLSLLAVVRALFAGRPSEFNGDPLILGALAHRTASVGIPRTDVAVRLSSLLVLHVAVPVLAVLWFLVGAFTVGVVGDGSLTEATLGTVMLAAVGILLSETAETAADYFYRGVYRDHSAQTAIRGVLVRGMTLFVGGLFTVMAVALVSDSIASDVPISELDAAVVGTPLLVGIVGVKFGLDLAGVYGDRLATFDESTEILWGWAYEPPTVEPVETTLSGAVDRIRPDRRGRLIGGVANLCHRPGAAGVGVFVLAIAGLFATGQVWDLAALLVGVAVVVPGGLLSVDYWLRYGAVEYRTDGEAIVAVDRLFGGGLWRVEPWDETDLRVERDRLDEFLGTHTVVVELVGGETFRLPRLAHPQPILDTFDRRADWPGE